MTPPELWRPRARVVAEIGQEKARAGEFTDPDRLTPIYLRQPEAQEKWETAQAEGAKRSEPRMNADERR